MTWIRVFLIVTLSALAGMAMGGVFGLGAGVLAPNLFRQIIPWADLEPRGVATVLGAVAGVLLGGGLGVFALSLQAFVTSRERQR